MLILSIPLLVALANAVIVPPPTGPFSVAINHHDLIDDSRWDRYAPADSPHKRRILVSSFVPVESSSCDDEDTVTPYLPPQTEVVYGQWVESTGVPAALLSGFEVGHCNLLESSESTGSFPLVIYSPGFTGTRLTYAVVARAIASLGYVVITTDHPYDALIVEFPDGSVITGPAMPTNETKSLIEAVEVRSQDVSFLIDYLQQPPVLGSDINLPIDFSKIIAIGHSMGGWTAAAASLTDDRILGGIDFDGMILDPVFSAGLSKPFLLAGPTNTAVQDWPDFYSRLDDAKMILQVANTTHYSFMDLAYLVTLIDIPAEALPYVQAGLGTTDGAVVLEFIVEVVAGLADLVFEGKTAALKGIDDVFEEVTVQVEDFPGSC